MKRLFWIIKLKGHSQQTSDLGNESHRPSQVVVLRAFRTYFLSAPLMLIALWIRESHWRPRVSLWVSICTRVATSSSASSIAYGSCQRGHVIYQVPIVSFGTGRPVELNINDEVQLVGKWPPSLHMNPTSSLQVITSSNFATELSIPMFLWS